MALLAAGCGKEPTTSNSDASQGWRSTQVAMAEAGLGVGLSGSSMVGPDGVSGVVMGTVDCPQGGSLEVTAQGEVDAEHAQGHLHVQFVGCQADGVTIDGSLEYEGSVDGDEVVAEYHGDLHWTGTAQGDCSVDIAAKVDASGASVSISGDVCGWDWTDLD